MRKKSLTFACIFIIFDQVIKFFINNSFSVGASSSVINNFFYITKMYNTGAAWSMFEGGRYMLIVISFGAFVFLMEYEKYFKYTERTVFAFALIYGGLIGNLIDRIYYGYVIDYLEFIFGKYHFPIFNLADMCLVIGFGLLLIGVLKGEDKNGVKVVKKRLED